ncbi:Dynamitin-domain-containing protein [Daldinia sp. FL1419]|nr:Dynamitin-domain-containing protein [Daldinia sp. FL1419]
MALNRKYAALPDLDSAPDIYETPELTDDNSTIPTTAGRSQSDNEFDEDDDDFHEISHSRLRIDQARSRFLPAHVDAQDVDFSDRLDGKRKSYKTSSRRQRILEDGTEQIGDLSDEEGGEDLQRKIARLKREIEEAKEEYSKQKTESTGSTEAIPGQDVDLVSLSQALEEISIAPERVIVARGPSTGTSKEAKGDGQITTQSALDEATYTVTYAPSYEQSHALAKAADFDRRLLLLEKAIGITSSSMPELEGTGLPRAIMPTLDTLQNQISTLSEASTSSLDSISRRVRTLTQEAEQLEKARRAAKAAQDSLASAGGSPVEADDSEQTAKINALYGTLPTIESLAPLLPPLLDRLRSLRAIHTDAATANETLERIEKSQSEMAADIKQWREGLDKIEAVMGEGGATMTANMKVVEGWVKDLEAKVAQLS